MQKIIDQKKNLLGVPVVVAVLTLVFWICYFLINGYVPEIDTINIIWFGNHNLSFSVSRWIDVMYNPIVIFYVFISLHGEYKRYKTLLFFILIIGIVYIYNPDIQNISACIIVTGFFVELYFIKNHDNFYGFISGIFYGLLWGVFFGTIYGFLFAFYLIAIFPFTVMFFFYLKSKVVLNKN